MHPDNENVLDLSSGQLYMTDEAGNRHALGMVKEMTITQEVQEDLWGLDGPVLGRKIPPFEVEMTVDIAPIWELAKEIVEAAQVCLAWAEEYRPKLLHLATYAKTKRRRRKNLHRILREFALEILYKTDKEKKHEH